ncbi:hypothetical protein [Bradyrhizobium sp. 150]|uniref:hypothetical protein n=1 Tax=Bradyrhizobium sp. 150 TaxID=2782625 RepID=UPI001FF78751|nr:hypothetical protein [Bradyrhizobium sp. 150]MCK1671093.1 hypothetical protein [Bradyrhizobium sp. 150]
MNAQALAKPDNEADMTISLAISGNRLVSVLNALDAAMYATGRYRFEGDNVVAESSWFAELRETTEAIRDELSRQRCSESEHKRAIQSR